MPDGLGALFEDRDENPIRFFMRCGPEERT
jgi:hypothetical protein